MLYLMEMIGTFLVVWKVTEVLMNLDDLVGIQGLVKNICKGMGWGGGRGGKKLLLKRPC